MINPDYIHIDDLPYGFTLEEIHEGCEKWERLCKMLQLRKKYLHRFLKRSHARMEKLWHMVYTSGRYNDPDFNYDVEILRGGNTKYEDFLYNRYSVWVQRIKTELEEWI